MASQSEVKLFRDILTVVHKALLSQAVHKTEPLFHYTQEPDGDTHSVVLCLADCSLFIQNSPHRPNELFIGAKRTPTKQEPQGRSDMSPIPYKAADITAQIKHLLHWFIKDRMVRNDVTKDIDRLLHAD